MTCHGIFLHLRLESDPTKGRTIKRTRYSEEQIIGILAEHKAGAKCANLCRKHGMSVSEAKWLKALAEENAKLKKLLAEQMLDLAAMRDLVSKKCTFLSIGNQC